LVDLEREQEKEKGLKEWAPRYYPKGRYETLKNQWQDFGSQKV
jgi:hypothetical protein